MTKSEMTFFMERASSLPNLNRQFQLQRLSIVDSSRSLVARTVDSTRSLATRERNSSRALERSGSAVGDNNGNDIIKEHHHHLDDKVDSSEHGPQLNRNHRGGQHRRSTNLTQRSSLASASAGISAADLELSELLDDLESIDSMDRLSSGAGKNTLNSCIMAATTSTNAMARSAVRDELEKKGPGQVDHHHDDGRHDAVVMDETYDDEGDGRGGADGHMRKKQRCPLHHSHLAYPLDHYLDNSDDGLPGLPRVHVLRRDYNNTNNTDTTMFSVLTPSDITSTTAAPTTMNNKMKRKIRFSRGRRNSTNNSRGGSSVDATMTPRRYSNRNQQRYNGHNHNNSNHHSSNNNNNNFFNSKKPKLRTALLNLSESISSSLFFVGRRRSALSMSEGQFRKKLRKRMEKGDWDGVRKLISNYDFSDIPELVVSSSSARQLLRQQQQNGICTCQNGKGSSGHSNIFSNSQGGDGSGSITNSTTGAGSNSLFPRPTRQNTNVVMQGRRPSYGERRSFTGSFTGKESAAAAAAIKAAASLEDSIETSSHHDVVVDAGGFPAVTSDTGSCFKKNSIAYASSSSSDIGENVLHDVCRHRPPLDVVESLLLSLRQHRRGCTSGKDDLGRTPLHVAAACGACPRVIEALARADPYPASVGDRDARSPLHLAVKGFEGLDSHNHSYGLNHSVNRGLKSRRGSEQQQHFNTGGHCLANADVTSRNNNHEASSIDILFRTIIALKSVMLTYPGKIDFKDDDNSGFNPLDYAIEKDLTDERIVQALIRRKCPGRRSTYHSEASADTQLVKNGSFGMSNSARRGSTLSHDSSDGQDIDVLRHLEDIEIQARKHRIQKIKAKRKEEHMNEALYDVFGIEEEGLVPATAYPGPSPSTPNNVNQNKTGVRSNPPAANNGIAATTAERETHESAAEIVQESSSPMVHRQPSSKQPMYRKPSTITEEESGSNKSDTNLLDPVGETPSSRDQQQHQTMTEEDIYNLHLQAYLQDFDEDILGDLQYCDEEEFDFEDPYSEEDDSAEREYFEQQEAARCATMAAEANNVFNLDCSDRSRENGAPPPIFEITLLIEDEGENNGRNRARSCDDRSFCHCSCVSEVTAPDMGGGAMDLS